MLGTTSFARTATALNHWAIFSAPIITLVLKPFTFSKIVSFLQNLGKDFRLSCIIAVCACVLACVHVCVCLCVYDLFYVHWFFLHVCLLAKVRKTLQIPETGFTGGCEPLYGCWESNPAPLKEQSVLLSAEPSLPNPEWRIFLRTWILSSFFCGRLSGMR